MDLIGQSVLYTHLVRGVKTVRCARITAIERGYIYISLEDGDKKLEFPNAFERNFLRLQDDMLQSEVEKLIEEQRAERERNQAAARENQQKQQCSVEEKKQSTIKPKRSINSFKGQDRGLKNEKVHENYSVIREVERTLREVRPDYESEIEGINKILKSLGQQQSLGLNDHVKAMVLAMLSNMREWKPIEDNLSVLEEIFCGYDADRLAQKDGAELVEQVKREKCGNLKINSQMTQLKDNIAVLEAINRKYGSIDAFYADIDKYELVALLSDMNSEYKLHEMGVPLVCEYLKGVGIPLVKPDRHVCRIIGRLGFSETIPAGEIETLRICDEIANALNMSHAQVDTILWQYGVKDKCGICGDQPDCMRCGVASCPNRAK